jgi:diaminopimelate epimerase
MDMGEARIEEGDLRYSLEVNGAPHECTIMWVGNPQCAFFVDNFDWDWKAFGAIVERHPHFPRRTNVSFVRVVDRAALDVRFFERGAGFTMSSGTGSTGAVAAARARGLVDDTVTVQTLAGPLEFRAEGNILHMRGPAQLIAGGEFYL